MNVTVLRRSDDIVLAPSVHPGEVVMIDDLPAHCVKGVRTAIEDAGAMLISAPPYSPDFNPIEQAFGKLIRERPPPDLWRPSPKPSDSSPLPSAKTISSDAFRNCTVRIAVSLAKGT
jgi:hypothetical protein